MAKKKRKTKKYSKKLSNKHTNWGLGGYIYHYDHDNNDSDGGDDGMSESLIVELMQGSEEAELSTNSRYAAAETLFRALVTRPEITRQEIIDAFMDNLGVTESTAVSYFQRIAKKMGLTNLRNDDDNISIAVARGTSSTKKIIPTADQDGEIPVDVDSNEKPDEKDKSVNTQKPIKRFVKGAHLVYKRPDGEGTFEELWIYPIRDNLNKALKIQKAILAGTDIPPKRMISADGSQRYTLTTLGDAQLLHITGLPN